MEDDAVDFADWHTPTSINDNAYVPLSDIDDLIACFGDDV
jgi:hypothetical protein